MGIPCYCEMNRCHHKASLHLANLITWCHNEVTQDGGVDRMTHVQSGECVTRDTYMLVCPASPRPLHCFSTPLGWSACLPLHSTALLCLLAHLPLPLRSARPPLHSAMLLCPSASLCSSTALLRHAAPPVHPPACLCPSTAPVLSYPLRLSVPVRSTSPSSTLVLSIPVLSAPLSPSLCLLLRSSGLQ